MRLPFCCACGNDDLSALEHHHFIPRSEGGPDDETNILTLCFSCHGKVHGIVRRNLSVLIKQGIARAKTKGVKFGRPRFPDAVLQDILKRQAQGQSVRVTAKAIGVSTYTVQRVRTGKY